MHQKFLMDVLKIVAQNQTPKNPFVTKKERVQKHTTH
jgi:hypothetical protein